MRKMSAEVQNPDCNTTDLICFSHLRWDFVYQRPQHLLSRFARYRRVFYIEEAILDACTSPWVEIEKSEDGVFVVTPHLSQQATPESRIFAQRSLLNTLIREHHIHSFTLWYYTPMALTYSDHLISDLIIYDCMDELSGFKFAPPELVLLEKQLMEKADLVFTGGQSIYEAKKHLHEHIYPFPSSIDVAHFGRARAIQIDPPDQEMISFPRLGYCGVIDERMDLELIEAIADNCPSWQLILLGPVVKIDAATLPQRTNIHYLGQKKYHDLPHYLAGWDIAILPFAHNPSTRFISPTKTPEYLAAGKPVVSTSIQDVIRPYGEKGLVRIADRWEDFIEEAEQVIAKGIDPGWLKAVDQFLSNHSWEKTWSQMASLEQKQILNNSAPDWPASALLSTGDGLRF